MLRPPTWLTLTCVFGVAILLSSTSGASESTRKAKNSNESRPLANQILTPDQLLKLAEDFRNPGESYRMRVRMESSQQATVFDIYLQGRDRTLIVTKEPARDRGRNLLMIDRDIYAYIPSLKRSQRLALAQRLAGPVAHGDLARTRWVGDYHARFNDGTPIGGAIARGQMALRLDAREKNLTYQSIELIVEAPSGRPIRADFLNVDGTRSLKQMRFDGYRQLAGRLRPSRLEITEQGNQPSRLIIESMQVEEIPAHFFKEAHLEVAR